MKLKDLRKSLRIDRRCVALDMSKLISGEIARFSDGTPAVFSGTFREGAHVVMGVDPGSGVSETFVQTVDANGRVISVRRLAPGEEESTRRHLMEHPHAPGLARLVATDLDERAGFRDVPGADCSAVPVCPREDTKTVFAIHRGCTVTSLGRSLGTLFSRYWKAPDPRSIEALKATFWETYDWAIHMMDPHSPARLVRLEENPKPALYETLGGVRDLRLITSTKRGESGRHSVFNLYPAEVDGCGCMSPWDGVRADCATCGGLGMVWRLRLHPVLLPERGATEALARMTARLKER